MNFFEAQDSARRATRWLVIVYVIATTLIVAGVTVLVAGAFAQQGRSPDPAVLLIVAFAATALIVGATLFKTARLSSGGGRVATDMGGTLVSENEQDPLRRRLRNVVEEMAIASGVPVPEIYVMEHEEGINAFAAGFTPGDAAIAVTRGTLELLNRDELQGVIAHEFSHILNGDMRLNIRMMGVLYGIMVIGLIGRFILRGSYHGSLISRGRNKNSGGALAIGLGLTVLGWIGVFFARIVKAAVSRQREFLADASAVQFTRQSDGIANALKKIGGFEARSFIKAADPEEVSHMLFAVGANFSSLFATPPPLTERIRAIDPQFDESQYQTVRSAGRQTNVDDSVAGPVAGFARMQGGEVNLPQSLAASIGRPGIEHIEFAQKLHRSIPADIATAAHEPARAYLMTLALIIDVSRNAADRQIDLLKLKLGDERAQLIRAYHQEILQMGEEFRLPLLEISFPALKRMPPKKLEFLLDLARELIELDGKIDFYEFCIYRILTRNLAQALAPSARRQKRRPASRSAVRTAAIEVIGLLADRGHESPDEKRQAFKAGLSVFGDWSESTQLASPSADAVAKFDQSLDVLQRMNSAATQSFLEAVNITASHDGKVSVQEAEMIRAICASLDYPLPPMLSGPPATK
ncbi:MAG: M48 family metallopeptidase [Gammaproteobacteria bacterium]|nr:M48 family metallopeptidase [Gammaproteobacteria bacterium]